MDLEESNSYIFDFHEDASVVKHFSSFFSASYFGFALIVQDGQAQALVKAERVHRQSLDQRLRLAYFTNLKGEAGFVPYFLHSH